MHKKLLFLDFLNFKYICKYGDDLFSSVMTSVNQEDGVYQYLSLAAIIAGIILKLFA